MQLNLTRLSCLSGVLVEETAKYNASCVWMKTSNSVLGQHVPYVTTVGLLVISVGTRWFGSVREYVCVKKDLGVW